MLLPIPTARYSQVGMARTTSVPRVFLAAPRFPFFRRSAYRLFLQISGIAIAGQKRLVPLQIGPGKMFSL